MIEKKLLDYAIEKLVESINPQRIIMFGSQARGTDDSRSDVDLLVISNFHGKRRDRLVELHTSLRDSGFAQDIVLMTPDEFELEQKIPGTIARPASREGIVLYERSGF